MEAKFKVGDKVRILDGSDIENYTGKWITDDISAEHGLNFSMEKHIGEVHTVRAVGKNLVEDRNCYHLADLPCTWDERGLELVDDAETEEPKPATPAQEDISTLLKEIEELGGLF